MRGAARPLASFCIAELDETSASANSVVTGITRGDQGLTGARRGAIIDLHGATPAPSSAPIAPTLVRGETSSRCPPSSDARHFPVRRCATVQPFATVTAVRLQVSRVVVAVLPKAGPPKLYCQHGLVWTLIDHDACTAASGCL